MSDGMGFLPSGAGDAAGAGDADADARTWSQISGFRQEVYRIATIPEHRHAEHELVAAARGTFSVQSSLGRWAVSTGMAVWIPATIPHAVQISAGTVLCGAYLAPDLMGDAPRWRLPHTLDVDVVLGALIERLGQHDLSDDRRGRASAAFLDVLDESSISGRSLPLPGDVRARAVAEALLDDPADPRELGDWAEELGVSTKTLSRAFHVDTGMTFTAWRARRRVGHALQRLGEGEAVGDVAARVGYGSTSAFIAAFRSQVGLNPGVYARSQRTQPPATA